MDKEFYDKYGKELDCKSCIGLQECSTNSNIPLCDKGYRRFAKDKIADLETELAEKDKEIEEKMMSFEKRCQEYYKSDEFKRDFAIQELEKVNGILTDTIIEITQNEMDLNKLCYLEEISARFYEKMQEQIKELEGQHND